MRLDRDPSSLKIFDSRNGGEETLGFEVASITLPDTQQVPTFTVSPIRNCLAIMKRSRETVFHEISRRGVKQSGRVNDTSNTVEKTVNICVDPLEEVCKCCLWQLQLSKLQEIYGNRRIYICLEIENSPIINNYIFNCYSEQV